MNVTGNISSHSTLQTSTSASLLHTTRPGGSSPNQKSQLVNRGLDHYLQIRDSREAVKWGIVNVLLLLILLVDICNKCPFTYSKWYHVEHAAACILGINVLYSFGKFFYFKFSFDPLKGTQEQRELLQFKEGDTSFITTPIQKAYKSMNNTPLNVTSLWHSSFNDSNRTIGSPGWIYNRSSPNNTFNQSYGQQNASWTNNNVSLTNRSPNSSAATTSFTSPYKNYSKDEQITDERELQQYMHEVALQEKNMIEAKDDDRSRMNSLWNYSNNAANLLKNTLYLMAPATVSPIKQASNKDEFSIFGGSTDLDRNSDIIKNIGSTGQLIQYVYNLRTWISRTIVQRLDAEITKTNASFELRGLADLKIGHIGLDRLKKTADNSQMVSMYAPMLPMIVPFMDVSANQEYLVKRINDLAKGCVLAEYRWNAGGSYTGLNWDEHLPTDSAIIFHLFCAYLDSQLPPIPQPGGRAFYNRYVVIGDKKNPKEILAEVKNKIKCAILCTNPMKPKFNFISDDKIHNCVHDRNNLLCVIVEFLVYMKTHNENLLEGVNLGSSGINLFGVIGE